MEDSYRSVRPVAGRLFALDLRPARPLTFLGPLWATLCGALAAGGVIYHDQWLLKLILLIVLCDALLGAWRALWLHADWRTALPHNIANARLWLMPPTYAPSALPQRLARAISYRIRFARFVIWPLIDSEIIGMILAGVMAVCLAVVLGLVPTILTALALVIALIEGQSPERGVELRGVYEIALPWLIAQSAFGYFSGLALAFVVLFTLIYRALFAIASSRETRWMSIANVAQLVVILILMATNTPAGAGIIALGLLAQVLWQIRYRVDRDGRAYAQRVQSYLLVEMLIAGLSLWL